MDLEFIYAHFAAERKGKLSDCMSLGRSLEDNLRDFIRLRLFPGGTNAQHFCAFHNAISVVHAIVSYW